MKLASILLPIGALLVAMVSIQAGASFAKALFPAVGAEGTTALRLGFGALMLTLVLRPWRARISRANWRILALYGVVLGLMNLCYYMSLTRIPLGIAAAIEFTGPLAVAVCTSRRRIDLIWVALAACGLLLLLPLDTSSDALDPIGVLYALLAGAGWGTYVIIGKRAGNALGSATPALGMIIGALVVLPFGVAQAGIALLSPALLPTALLVAALSSAIPFALEMVALRRLPPQTYGTLTSMEPAIGALAGLVILHEALPVMQWLAIGLIISASIGTTLAIRPEPVVPLPD
ncbi:EamA family transporter [Dongia rigui]|uniref:EamA family transporter n=1 Tax=Dongia rigui TaxID=940149 RepID=A0ABU5E0M7_9PROT|nr:EamA family transporter [Dongia rigui]MDY0873090.1 EamA family transporter [Dongia rigui]